MNNLKRFQAIKKVIIENLKKEYKKKTKELISYIFKSSYSLAGLEFDSLTESDLKNAKFIHWPSYAKRNELVYKKFLEEKAIKIVLAVDEVIFFNNHYFSLFLSIKEDINKQLPSFIKKYLLLLNKGKKISLNNVKVLNKYLKESDFNTVNYSSLFKEKDAFVLIISDFLHKKWDFETLNNLIAKGKSEYFFVFFLPKYDLYFPLDLFFIYKNRKKVKSNFKKIKTEKKFIL